MGMPTSTTLSSVGASAAIETDWMAGKPVAVGLTFGSTTMTADATIQVTYDQSSATTRRWFDGSSHISATGFTSWWHAPIAAVRINSTAISSSTLVLTVGQGIGT